jgi:large subunit ribosomal protein L25
MSTTYELKAQARDVFGKGNARRARKDGLIPAVVYSKGAAAESIFVKDNEWAALMNNAGVEELALIVGDVKKNVVIKEVQQNFLKGYVVHIDFMEVK